jgi:hypothetical protein
MYFGVIPKRNSQHILISRSFVGNEGCSNGRDESALIAVLRVGMEQNSIR